MFFRQIRDPKLSQYAYLVGCQRTGEAVIIDPQRDVDRYLAVAEQEGLDLIAAAETHIHADFLSGARELAEAHGVKLYLSAEGGPDWQYEWAKNGDYDLHLLRDGDRFEIGRIRIQALHTPGHTPEHLSFLITDHGGGVEEPMGIATGDFVFVGDLGRPDLLETAAGQAGQQEPSARTLYQSVHSFLHLPDYLQLWPGHGAGSACGKALGAVPASTVGYEKRFNAAIDASRQSEDHFVHHILEGQPEPPLYFATMKRLNREGPPVLHGLPRPPRLSPTEVASALLDGVVVVDTRTERRRFMEHHLLGSLYAPLNNTFPTIAGSYVRPEDDILLVVDPERSDEAVRDLVRIGLDRVVGYAPPEVLNHPTLAAHLQSIPIIDFPQVADLVDSGDALPLDVRSATEHAASRFRGSLHIPHTRLLDRLDEVPKDREILAYCASGARSAAASALLQRSGRRVRYVDDDFAHWHGARRSA
jgi:hydroxyacylglutathione hydrolase